MDDCASGVLLVSVKTITAIVVFLVGLVFLVWSWSQSRAPQVEQPEVVVTDTVQSLLADDRFDTAPSKDELGDVFADIQRVIEQKASDHRQIRLLGTSAVQDLGLAFVERLQLMLVPEFERDYRASVKRGDPMPRDEAFDKAIKAIEYYAKNPRKLDMGLQTIEVNLLSVDHESDSVSGRDWADEGFGYLSCVRNKYRFPAPDNPVQSGWMCAEVTMLLMCQDAISSRYYPALAGYHFAWNAERQQWVPFQSVVYRSPDHVFAAPPL